MTERLKMFVWSDALHCTKCWSNLEKHKHKPTCWTAVCPNAEYQCEDVEQYFLGWRMLHGAKSVPRALLLREMGLDGATDLEILTGLDVQFQAFLAERREDDANKRRR